jgi:DNA topoisomerase I
VFVCGTASQTGDFLACEEASSDRKVPVLRADSTSIHLDSRSAAATAGLRYCADSEPGITRRRHGKGFVYRHSDRTTVDDPQTLARIRTLAIPPAWTDVWIAADANVHIAATGRDARGRKQYRYNPDFVRVRDQAKFEHLIVFAKSLPRIRKRIAADLGRAGLKRERVLATIVQLLDATGARIGNEDYAKANGSFGLTTLRNRHVEVHGREVKFLFNGKGGKEWQFRVHGPRVARVVRACQDLPGQHLFAYRDEEGMIRKVSSDDVNAYLREASGTEVTAKDFRTWNGTLAAAMFLKSVQPGSAKRRAVREALEVAARRLRNTIAVCRRCYVHPAVISGFEAGTLALRVPRPSRATKGLSGDERALLRYLERCASEQQPAANGRAQKTNEI